MTETIETAVKTDVVTTESKLKSLESRMLALESEAAGYVRAHMVYFLVGIAFVVGGVLGHIVR